MPTMMDIKFAVDAVLEYAEKLRQAGVTRFALGDLAVDLAPFVPEHEYEVDAKPDERPKSLWNDPDLYGRPQDATGMP
jgi:hypothetical protein